MADKTTELIVAALNRAALAPEGLPLQGAKSTPSMFPTGAVALQAARRCVDDGLVRVLHTKTRGKSVQEICALTEKGLAYLFSRADPKQLLEDFVRAIEGNNEILNELIRQVREHQANMGSLKGTAEKVLHQVADSARNGAAPIAAASTNGDDSDKYARGMIERLRRWRDSGAPEDCPLPELFHHARTVAPALTLGAFHDSVRRYHQEAKIYLHPWTGPLYELPEPALALLVGHEIVYYASLRDS